MATAYVRTPDGQVFQGPEENLGQLQSMVPGAQVLTPEEAQAEAARAQLRAEEGGLTGAAKQLATSVIEGGTMLPVVQGLERAYGYLTGGQKGADEAAERIRVREEEQRGAALAGQAIGFGGAALLTGGLAPEAGALARGVRAATTIPRQVMAAGAAAAERAGARVAEEGLKRSIVGAVARGATEGAALGAGQIVKDVTVGEDITGELVTERLLGGALLGAAGGALFEGLGAAAVKAAEAANTGTIGTLVGGLAGGSVAGLPGAIGGAALGRTVGRTIGKSAAAGERAAIADIAERELATAAQAGKKVVQRDLDATERRALLDAAEAEETAATLPREDMASAGLESAEDDLQRQRVANLNKQFRDNYAAADAMAPQVEELAARFRDAESGAAAQARRKLAEATDQLEKSAVDIGRREGLFQKIMVGVRTTHETTTGQAKFAKVLDFAKRLGDAEAEGYAMAARERLGTMLTDYATRLEDGIVEMPGLKVTLGRQIKQLRKAATEIERTSLEGDQKAALAKIHQAADVAKREFDSVIAKKPPPSAGMDEQTFLRSLRTEDGLSTVRRALESPELFGEEIAATQIQLNRNWRNSIPEMQNVSKAYMREGLDPNEIDPFKLDQVVDPAKLIPTIRNLGSVEQEETLNTLRRFVNSQESLQRNALERFEMRDVQRLRIQESLDALQKMRTELEKAVEASRLQQAAKIISEDALEQLKMGAAAKIPGIGQAVTMMLDLERRATMERALAGLVGDADKQIADAAKAFVRGAERPGRAFVEAVRGVAAEATGKPAPQIKPKEAVAKELATAAPRETREQMAAEALRQMATVASVAGTPHALDAFAFAGTQPIQFTSDPRLSTAVANATARAMAFLYSKRPPVFESDTLQPQLVQRQLSDGQLATWRAYVTTAAKPLSVLDDLSRGTVRKEQVETLRALYPALYSSIQAKILDTLHDTRAQISFPQRVLLFQMFGAATDPSLNPTAIRAIQASYKPAQPAPSGASRATPGRVRGSFAAGMRTGTESLSASKRLP